MRGFLVAPAALVVAVACAPSTSPSDASIENTEPPLGSSGEDATPDEPPGHTPPDAGDSSTPQFDAAACVTNLSDGGAAALSITVDALRGPHGSAAPAKVDRRLLGMNIADWRPQDYVPTPKPAFKAMLGALKPGVLRWPAGHRSQEYKWERGGDGQWGDWTLTAAHVDAFIALAKSVGAEPAIALNVKRGTPAAAADLVKYVNVEKKYGVKWFLVGNEPDLTDGIIGSPEAFVEKYVAFVDAMREVDKTAKFVGPELLTGAHVNGIHGRPDWLTPLLTQAVGRVDGMSWHYYPLDSGQKSPTSSATMSIEHLFQETAPDWRPASIAYADEVMPALAAMRQAHAPNAGVWITEFAEDPGPGAGAGISETIAGALWVGDALGRYAEYAPDAIIRWVFKTVESHAYGLIDVNDEPRPAYGTYWLYARHMGDRYVHSESSARTDVAVHASLRADGALAVMLVNKTTSPQQVSIRLDNFCTGSASDVTLTGDGYGATSFAVNGQTLSSATVESIAASPVDPAKLFDLDLPPTSVRVVAYRKPE